MRYYLPGFPQQDEEVQTSGKEVKKKHIFQTNLSLGQTQTFTKKNFVNGMKAFSFRN